ncbi:hypothetical protein KR059_008159 [Drosophila kikkawai]|nr:hypothetical protein KR059_008159 [Drosophila kikkawai]
MDQNNEREQLQAEEPELDPALNIRDAVRAFIQALPEEDHDADLANGNVQLLSPYICRHCRDYVRGGVITICGHMFCWTCLWPLLVESPSPVCPLCQTELILHVDIIPFYGEGPNSGAADGEFLAEPGAVPRPSGICFAEPNEDVAQNGGINARIVEQYFAQRIQWLKRKLSFPRIKLTVTYLQWLQVICVILMLLVWQFV